MFGGKAEVTGAIPPGYGDYPLTPEKLAELYANDVDAAKQLMIDAGFEDGFEVELQAIAAPRSYTQNAEIVSEAVKQLNIDAKVVPLEIGTFADNNGKGLYQWQATGRGMRGDPSGYVIDFRQGTTQNVTWFGDGWNNDEFNTLYDQALAELDQTARVPMYQRMQEIIAEDAANLYLVQPYKFQVVNNRLTGMYVSFSDTIGACARLASPTRSSSGADFEDGSRKCASPVRVSGRMRHHCSETGRSACNPRSLPGRPCSWWSSQCFAQCSATMPSYDCPTRAQPIALAKAPEVDRSASSMSAG